MPWGTFPPWERLSAWRDRSELMIWPSSPSSVTRSSGGWPRHLSSPAESRWALTEQSSAVQKSRRSLYSRPLIPRGRMESIWEVRRVGSSSQICSLMLRRWLVFPPVGWEEGDKLPPRWMLQNWENQEDLNLPPSWKVSRIGYKLQPGLKSRPTIVSMSYSVNQSN